MLSVGDPCDSLNRAGQLTQSQRGFTVAVRDQLIATGTRQPAIAIAVSLTHGDVMRVTIDDYRLGIVRVSDALEKVASFAVHGKYVSRIRSGHDRSSLGQCVRKVAGEHTATTRLAR